MHSLTCMSVVVCVVRKLRPCNSYSRRRDRINSVLWRSYYKGGGGTARLGKYLHGWLRECCMRAPLHQKQLFCMVYDRKKGFQAEHL